MTPKGQVGLWIANDILFSDLALLEKVILADIVSLSSGQKRFFKTNKVLADTFNVSLRTVNYAVKKLVDRGLVTSEISFPYGTVVKKRVLIPNKIKISKLCQK